MPPRKTRSPITAEIEGDKPAEGPQKFLVSVKGYPLQGFVEKVSDEDGERYVVHAGRPLATHYRCPPSKWQPGLPEGWRTERELRMLGMSELPTDWWKRSRPRIDITSCLFAAAVVEARSARDARDAFSEAYSLTETKRENWDVKPAPAHARVGPCQPKKARGVAKKLAAQDLELAASAA